MFSKNITIVMGKKRPPVAHDEQNIAHVATIGIKNKPRQLPELTIMKIGVATIASQQAQINVLTRSFQTASLVLKSNAASISGVGN